MRIVRRSFEWLRVIAVAVMVWSLAPQMLLAENKPAAPTQTTAQSYPVPYMLVVLATALGLMIVCRSANRTTDLSRSDDD